MTKPIETKPTVLADVNAELLGQIKAMGEQMATMQAQLNAQTERDKTEDSNVVDPEERRHARQVEIASYKDMPIIDMRLVERTSIDGNGQTIINGMEAVCKVHGTEKEVKLTYGDMKNADDYLRLPRKVYHFVDVITDDPNELSGASKIARKQLVSTNGTVAENQLVNNALVPTGRVIPVNVWKDVRYYTIMVGDEKVTLAEDKIYR